MRLRTPAEAVDLGIGYIPRERRVEGLVLFLPVAANITLADLDSLSSYGLIDAREERRLATSWVERLKVRTPSINTLCLNLSGGNQQKVVLAKWLNAKAKVLILDHPTRGLDVGAKEEVYELVRAVTAEGVAVILTSDTLEETIGLSHTVLVMRDGEITHRTRANPGRKAAAGRPDRTHGMSAAARQTGSRPAAAMAAAGHAGRAGHPGRDAAAGVPPAGDAAAARQRHGGAVHPGDRRDLRHHAGRHRPVDPVDGVAGQRHRGADGRASRLRRLRAGDSGRRAGRPALRPGTCAAEDPLLHRDAGHGRRALQLGAGHLRTSARSRWPDTERVYQTWITGTLLRHARTSSSSA